MLDTHRVNATDSPNEPEGPIDLKLKIMIAQKLQMACDDLRHGTFVKCDHPIKDRQVP